VSGILTFRNRHRTRRVNLRFLRRIAQALLRDTSPNESFDLGVYLVAAPEMTRLNETFLRHHGSTDVITFDYAEGAASVSRLSGSGATTGRAKDRQDACPALLHGEIFICLDEAVSQARRYHATWQSEVVRYLVHGVLHLMGHDDQDRQSRRQMRAAENAQVRRLSRQFDFQRLGRKS
jgi:rRNA maturation RNase YbeY